jgi:hypothetical protein
VIIVVGGHGRHAGKTQTVCGILEAFPEARWTAVKVTAHAHGVSLDAPVWHQEQEPDASTDTGRYLRAGAARALWLRCRPDQLENAVAPFRTGNVIFESNSVTRVIQPDVLVFVAGSGATKASAAGLLECADFVVFGEATPPLFDHIRLLFASAATL